MQRAERVDGGQCARDLRAVGQGLGGGDAVAHATAQVAMREILHRQVGVIVRHAQFVQPHDVGMANALADLVFLQEAPECLIDTGLIAQRRRHLECHQRADLLALRQVELRDRAARQQARAAVAGNARLTEAPCFLGLR